MKLKLISPALLTGLCLLSFHSAFADTEKVKVLDKFDTYDTKTVQAYDANIKSVATPDPLHPRVLELFIDYAKPGGRRESKRFFRQALSVLNIWRCVSGEIGVSVHIL
jgi:hypothetical protein